MVILGVILGAPVVSSSVAVTTVPKFQVIISFAPSTGAALIKLASEGARPLFIVATPEKV